MRPELRWSFLGLLLLLFAPSAHAECTETARLLAVGWQDKMIVISTRPGNERLLLDGASARITIFGKPGEWKELSRYSLIRVRYGRTPVKRLNQQLDGNVHEICVEYPKRT